jgi:succinate dehydrogenase / fumarate reductase, membrane anchor subunit
MMSNDNPNAMRTPLKNVRSLGSAKEGATHFWQQRLTAVANVVLLTFLVGLVVYLAGSEHAVVKRTLSNPVVALMLLLLILSGIFHMRLGMQVIIEDYVRAEGKKVMLVMANTFFAIIIGTACVFAVLKLSFGV